MSIVRALPLAGALVLFATVSSLADNPGHTPNGNAWGYWKNNGGGASHSAPGPVVGFGLPALAAYGAYLWIRRMQRPK